MIPTVPIDLALNLAVGSSFALAGRHTLHGEKLMRTTAFWAVVLFELLVFVPVGAYLLLHFPDWSFMYLWQANSLPFPDWALAASYMVAGLAGFLVTRSLILGRRSGVGFGFLVGTILLSLAITGLGSEQLLHVGSTAAFTTGTGQMLSVFHSPLAVVLVGAAIAVVGGWGVNLWRLTQLNRLTAPPAEPAEPTMVKPKAKKKAKSAPRRKTAATRKV